MTRKKWPKTSHYDKDELNCSFCGKSRRVVPKLIAGPGVFICTECVALCNEIIDDKPTQSIMTVQFPRLDSISDTELLSKVKSIAASVAVIDDKLQEVVLALRARGVTWQKIGESLGTTRQAAWERFSGEE